MKILIDSRGANLYRGTGIGTYTHNLLKGLISIDKNNSYYLFCVGPNFSEYESVNTKIFISSRKHKTFFEEFYIPECSKHNQIDIFHVPQNGIGLSDYNNETINIATIHDLIPYVLPETTGPSYLKNFLKKMPNIIENCDGILTVSEYSKKDILKFFPSFPSERIFVTPLAANSEYKLLNKTESLNTVQKRFNFTGEYIMYIGGFSTRKNVQGLIESFDKIYNKLNKNIKLLLVGGLRDEGKRLESLSQNLSNSNKIIFTGFIEEEFLPVLYNGCKLFVYPSFYEGFGLPPLEAMSCGTPALSSNTTSIPEVVRIKELLFDPYSSTALENKLIMLLNNDELLKKLEAESLRLSKEFSWENTALTTLAAYKKIYELGKR
ncbi:MAG: glycosyltransferase family 4 protein [Sarcina sp.]